MTTLIDPEKYFDLVMKGFAHIKEPLEIEDMTILTEDLFRLQWLTRIRFNSYISLADEIDEKTMSVHRMRCVQLGKKNRSKLAEPIVCNVVVISENVSEDAKEFALKRPKRHTTMDEYPIIVDLKAGEVYYYTGAILYGFLYEKFQREYIDGHFAMPMRILKEKG